MTSAQAAPTSPGALTSIGLVAAAALVGGSVIAVGTPLAAGLVAVLCAVAVATIYLRAAVIAAVFLLPILPVQLYVDLGPSLPLATAGRVVLGVILLAALINVLLGGLSISRSGIGIFMLGWVAAAALSIPGSIAVGVSEFRLGLDVIEYFALFYLVLSVFRRDQLETPLFALVAGAATNACFAIFEFFFFNPFLKLPGATADLASRSGNPLVSVLPTRLGFPRVQGSFQTAPYLAASLAMIIPVCYVLLLVGGSNTRRRRFLAYALGLQLIALLITFTRGAWFAAVFGLVVVIFVSLRRVPKVATHLLAALCVVMLLAVALPNASAQGLSFVGDVFSRNQDSSLTTSGYRLLLAQRSLEVAKERPINGWGDGTFDRIGINAVRNGIPFMLTSPDNHFVRVLVETGIVGFLAFIALMLALLGAALRSVASQRFWQDRAVAAAIVAALVGFIFVNISFGMFPVDQVTFVFWILAAVAVRLRLRDGDTRASQVFGITESSAGVEKG